MEITAKYIEKSDRIIFVERNFKNEVIGLNFMQGDEVELFKTSYMQNDPELLRFFHKVSSRFNLEKTMENIDQIIWLSLDLEFYFDNEE